MSEALGLIVAVVFLLAAVPLGYIAFRVSQAWPPKYVGPRDASSTTEKLWETEGYDDEAMELLADEQVTGIQPSPPMHEDERGW